MSESLNNFAEKLEDLLALSFSAQGNGLEAKARSIARELPEDLLELLIDLSRQSSNPQNEDSSLPEFAFRCGQAHERLSAIAQNRLAADIAFVGTDGSPPPALEKSDLDALARFVALRDRLLRTVADYTLKFLLVSVILLAIGLSLGLI